jgi:hypothetical protein
MAPRAGHLPNYRERIALQKLVRSELPIAKLHPTGKPTLSKMMKKGWLEQDGAEGSITPAGRVALKAKIPAERRGASLAGWGRGQGRETTLGHNDE